MRPPGSPGAEEQALVDARLDARSVAEAAGVEVEAVDEWRRLGLIEPAADGSYDPVNLERARLVAFAVDRGVDAAAVARVSEEQQDLLGRFVEFAGPATGVGRSLEEAAGAAGLDVATARRLWRASGFADQAKVFDDDLQLLVTAAGALAIGLPEDALLQLVRVYVDAIRRIAEAESRLFHLHVHEQLRHQGLSGDELAEATRAAGDPLVSVIEPTILYFHRKAWVRALREDLLLHLRQDTVPTGAVDELPIAVLFVDLASFTPFTESAGDAAAASVVERFADVVRDRAVACHGQVIKQVGDELMVVFDAAHDAVRCGAEIQSRAEADPDHLGVRAGAHSGTAVYREADYFGTTVNVAARVTSEAVRGQFLVTADVRQACDDLPDIAFTSVGTRQLKGVRSPVELFAVSIAEPPG